MTLHKLKTSMLKLGLVAAVLTSFLSLFSFATTSALSLNDNVNYFSTQSTTDACQALSDLNSSQGCNSQKGGGGANVQSLIKTIVNILSLVVGAAAVIMIILSGMRFITSGGDAQKVSSAKSSLIYALIGLIIVALTQAIIHFTLDNAAKADPGANGAGIIEVMRP
jgi:hypothetical protein